MTPFAPLGDVCDIQSGGTPPRSRAEYYDGDIPWAKISDIEAADGTTYETEERITEAGLRAIRGRIFPQGTLLFAMYGSIGKMAFAGRDMATNQAILGITVTDSERVIARFIYHWLAANKALLLSQGRGITQKNLSATYLRELSLPLPPLEEQRWIIAMLDRADDLRRKRRLALEKLNALPQTVFKEMFGDASSPKNARSVARLSEVTSEIYRYPTYFGITYEPTGIPEIRGELINEDGSVSLDAARLRYISMLTSQRFPRTVVSPGDLIMTVRGTIGKLAIVPSALTGANITANLIRISPNLERIEPIYLFHALRSRGARAKLSASASLTTISTIKASDLRNIPIAVPPMKEQREFVTRFKVIEKLIVAERAYLAKCNQLFGSLENRAFRRDGSEADAIADARYAPA